MKAAVLAKVPKGLDLIEAAALPLVTTTGNQLLLATGVQAGKTVLILGAAGNVGRSAVFTAKARGASVIAGVLKRQFDVAKTVGADQVIATDDDTAIANLAPLDAVADAVGGKTAEKLIAKVKPGGIYASVVGAPQNAAEYPSVKIVKVFSKFDRKTLEFMAEAVRDGKLVIPIGRNYRSVKRPRLMQWRRRVGWGRSCWLIKRVIWKRTWKNIAVGSILIQSRAEMGASNARRYRKGGGSICVGVRIAGTSVAATVLPASMRPSMRQKQGIRSFAALSQVKIGSTITRRKR